MVPAKYTAPATRPYANPRGAERARSKASSSGTSAIHAQAGCPTRGKASTSSTPDAAENAKSRNRLPAAFTKDCYAGNARKPTSG